MRILFLTPYLPYPPTKGTALRNLYILRAVARKHSVHLLTFASDADRVALEVLRSDLEGIEVVAPPGRSTFQRLAGLRQKPDRAARRPARSSRKQDELRGVAARIGEVREEQFGCRR